MVDWTLVGIVVFALCCSTMAYRAVETPKTKDGMLVLHRRVLVKGLVGGCVFLVAMLLGGMVATTLG